MYLISSVSICATASHVKAQTILLCHFQVMRNVSPISSWMVRQLPMITIPAQGGLQEQLTMDKHRHWYICALFTNKLQCVRLALLCLALQKIELEISMSVTSRMRFFCPETVSYCPQRKRTALVFCIPKPPNCCKTAAVRIASQECYIAIMRIRTRHFAIRYRISTQFLSSPLIFIRQRAITLC